MNQPDASKRAGLLVAGGTGLIGREVIAQAREQSHWQPLYMLARRALPVASDVRLLQVDFGALPPLPESTFACCALGTTTAVAGSNDAFRAVDLHAVVAFALAAKRAGAKRFAVVSALGANVGSSVFYNRTKGEAEQALIDIGFDALIIARPSLLLGDRASLGQPTRFGERLAVMAAGPLAGMIPRKWRPIHAATVARAMLRTLRECVPGTTILESADLLTWGEPARPPQAN